MSFSRIIAGVVFTVGFLVVADVTLTVIMERVARRRHRREEYALRHERAVSAELQTRIARARRDLCSIEAHLSHGHAVRALEVTTRAISSISEPTA